MDRWRGKVAVVTGASAGIGLATAKALVQEGMTVIGLARRKEKMLKEMDDVKGPGQFYAKECDVSKESDVIQAFEYVERTFNALHVLVNNAGLIIMKSIEKCDTAELDRIIDVNFRGLLHCSRYAIKLMKANNNEAHIVNLSSIAGHKVPNSTWFGGGDIHTNIYSATKFAVTSLSEIFTNELRGNKIRVTNLSPGYVVTDIFGENHDETPFPTGEKPSLTSKDVADAIVYVLGTPPHVQITQLTIKPLGEPF